MKKSSSGGKLVRLLLGCWEDDLKGFVVVVFRSGLLMIERGNGIRGLRQGMAGGHRRVIVE